MKLSKESTEGEEKRAKNWPWGRQARKEQEEGKEWPKKTEEEQQRAVTRKSREKSFLKDMLSGPVIVEKKSPLAVTVWETLVSLAKQFWKSDKDRNKIAAIEEWDVARMGFFFVFKASGYDRQRESGWHQEGSRFLGGFGFCFEMREV